MDDVRTDSGPTWLGLGTRSARCPVGDFPLCCCGERIPRAWGLDAESRLLEACSFPVRGGLFLTGPGLYFGRPVFPLCGIKNYPFEYLCISFPHLGRAVPVLARRIRRPRQFLRLWRLLRPGGTAAWVLGQFGQRVLKTTSLLATASVSWASWARKRTLALAAAKVYRTTDTRMNTFGQCGGH